MGRNAENFPCYLLFCVFIYLNFSVINEPTPKLMQDELSSLTNIISMYTSIIYSISTYKCFQYWYYECYKLMILDIKNIFKVCYLKYFHNSNINSSQMVTTFYSPFSRLGKPKPFINICFQIEAIIKISKGNVLHLLVEID